MHKSITDLNLFLPGTHPDPWAMKLHRLRRRGNATTQVTQLNTRRSVSSRAQVAQVEEEKKVKHVIEGKAITVIDPKARGTTLRTMPCERCGKNVGIAHAVSFFSRVYPEDYCTDELSDSDDSFVYVAATGSRVETVDSFCLASSHWDNGSHVIVMQDR